MKLSKEQRGKLLALEDQIANICPAGIDRPWLTDILERWRNEMIASAVEIAMQHRHEQLFTPAGAPSTTGPAEAIDHE